MKELLLVSLLLTLQILVLTRDDEGKNFTLDKSWVITNQNSQQLTEVGYLTVPNGILILKKISVATGMLFDLEAKDHSLPQDRCCLVFSADKAKLRELLRLLDRALTGSIPSNKPRILPDFTGEIECVVHTTEQGKTNIVMRDNPNHLVIRKIIFTLDSDHTRNLQTLIRSVLG